MAATSSTPCLADFYLLWSSDASPSLPSIAAPAPSGSAPTFSGTNFNFYCGPVWNSSTGSYYISPDVGIGYTMSSIFYNATSFSIHAIESLYGGTVMNQNAGPNDMIMFYLPIHYGVTAASGYYQVTVTASNGSGTSSTSFTISAAYHV